MATVSLSPQQRRTHGVWDVSFERMLEMEAAVEEGQSLGALLLDWFKIFDTLERDVGNSWVQMMIGQGSNALVYAKTKRIFTEQSRARGERWNSGADTRQNERTRLLANSMIQH